MMRIFWTRLVSAVTRFFLLVSCLQICVACATPFPVESLEEGMTAEAVREEFGAPTEAHASEDAKSRWTYVNEERIWFSDPPSAIWLLHLVVFPAAVLSIPVNLVIPNVPWDAAFVVREPVRLHFREEKLVRWDVIHAPEADPPALDWSEWPLNPNADPPGGIPGCRIRGDC